MPHALTGNAANPDAVNFAKRVKKREAGRRYVLLRAVLSTYEGREFLWQELERHGIHDLVSGPSEVVYTFLGRRNAGIELFVELKDAHGDGYLLMHKEAIERIARAEREIEAAQTLPAQGA
jgi:hypothetical protein